LKFLICCDIAVLADLVDAKCSRILVIRWRVDTGHTDIYFITNNNVYIKFLFYQTRQTRSKTRDVLPNKAHKVNNMKNPLH